MYKLIKMMPLLLCLFLASCGGQNSGNEDLSGSKGSFPEELAGMSDVFTHVFTGDDFVLTVPDDYWIIPGNTWTGMVYTVNDDVKDYIKKVSPFGNDDITQGSNYFVWSISEHNDHGMNAESVFDELHDEEDPRSRGFTVTPEHLSQPVYVIINDLSGLAADDLDSGCFKTVSFYLDEPDGNVFAVGGYVVDQEMEEVFLDVIGSLEYRDR
ncbi:MAG: hypothetical protein K5648_07620 [Erysipelotrichaceae bacterium]|nr:hypothetical protein [Erysipelotrichaceae bacterium]